MLEKQIGDMFDKYLEVQGNETPRHCFLTDCPMFEKAEIGQRLIAMIYDEEDINQTSIGIIKNGIEELTKRREALEKENEELLASNKNIESTLDGNMALLEKLNELLAIHPE